MLNFDLPALHDFTAPHVGHLENNGSRSSGAPPHVDKFHSTVSVSQFINIVAYSPQKSLEVLERYQAHSDRIKVPQILIFT